MESLGWRQRRGSSPAARRGARQRAGLTPVSASNILSCERETLTQSPIKKSLDSDHGIYRDHAARKDGATQQPRPPNGRYGNLGQIPRITPA
jgi:hypothetical protein